MPATSHYAGNTNFTLDEAAASEPASDQVRIRVAWCGICGTDMHIFHGRMDARVEPPQIIGHEMSGVIDAIGTEVSGWQVGDHVTVRPLDNCGGCAACQAGHTHVCSKLNFIGIDSAGAFQESWNVPARLLHRLPADLPLDRAALVEPIAVACHDVRRAELQTGEKAVILGGGPIGLLVALVAQAAGAQVMISELSDERRAFAEKLGFATCNTAKSDPLEVVQHWTKGIGADVVFECTAAAPCAELMTKLARVRGRVVVVGIFAEPPKVDLFQIFWKEVSIIGARVYEAADFDQAIRLAGTLPLDDLITGRFPLADINTAFYEAAKGMKTLVHCSAAT